MRVREVKDEAERARLWDLAVAAYPPYAEYQTRTTRRIPLFVAEPVKLAGRVETVLRRVCHANREYRVGASGDG